MRLQDQLAGTARRKTSRRADRASRDDRELSTDFIAMPNSVIGLSDVWGDQFYFQKAGFHLIPSDILQLHREKKDSAYEILSLIFVNAIHPIDEALIGWLCKRLSRTPRTIKKALSRIEEAGYTKDGFVAPDWLNRWKREWKKAEQQQLVMEHIPPPVS